MLQLEGLDPITLSILQMAQEIGIIPEEPNYVNLFRMQRNSNTAEVGGVIAS